ncbi:ABC transporter ATP-binding protein [Proteiniclasticum ruminis]|jgi:oligopeptide/dipeptide ABC transporter ATP-binding protein|uniref:Peptide/nickel transport system ATP-binding protein/oligopeptide transport system ATP-binding protein n=1 Tax=Proteiniclasticum ruminis TaxID=398199 RepID=A0A1G8GKI3_9CLOT|nr:ABC transporter ATP-binding protein [Proteiniclasticum ruminis]MBP9920462.1 ABC transporter ATP-binding protein [Proteiniclasticum sp.]SDH94836.1 peptide/nickel transport system ATP-binding protein/oligopeptide transport system ATP-binding protein [Proteiniclasticum ruminis]
MKKVLEVRNLKTHFFTDKGVVKAVDGVNFDLYEGKTLGIVGESGCGKSITSMSILKLIDKNGNIVDGSIMYGDKDIVKLPVEEMRKIRGNEISMIFQEPMTSLNPVFRIGDQIIESIKLHQDLSKQEAHDKAVNMLKLVGIPRAERVVYDYPHQLSGGMRQRAMIAMALACDPKVLIADEPTTALDVTIQAQILSLMNDLKEKTNTAIMLITHDLGVVAQMADDVIVMYSGKVVESAEVKELYGNPKHPYTQGLLDSIPDLKSEKKRLNSIEGVVPNPMELPKGCYFAPRCKFAMDKCWQEEPGVYFIDKEKNGETHQVKCFLYEDK